jgi:SNF2 family DNA or RNA helicase
LNEVVWDVVILDEAQNIKNSSAKRSEAVFSLPKNSSVAITGTPIENSLSDIWSIFRFLEPGLLGDEYAFNSRYPDTHASAVELSKQISPFVIRRRVSEVAGDLPERSDYFVPIFLSEEMNLRYEEIRNDPNLHQLPKMQALRQIAAVPSEYTYSSNKVSRLVDLLEEAFSNRDKAIIFASFTNTIDSLVRVIQTKFPNAFVETLDGRKSPQARQEVIDQFDGVAGASVLIANPRAAGVGLNIQAANYVFHFNPEWNPALIAQASARAYRRGQEKNVFVYYLYYRGTVEEYVLKKLEEKQTLQEAGLQELSDEPTESQLLEALRISPTDLAEIRK